MVINFVFICISIYFINFFLIKKNFLKSNTGLKHQSFANKSIPLTGGIFILLPVIYLFYESYLILNSVYFLLFIVGILSDSNILQSPKKRFLLQFLFILCFVLQTKLEVLPTRIDIIDKNISGTYASFFLTTFCLMVLINGSNFIDGLNGLLLGYCLIVFFIIYKLNLYYLMDLEDKKLMLLFLTIFVIFFLNFFNQMFLGDNGAYSISFLLGFILIEIYNASNNISPYFVILLLWFPCFENLFSILRKFVAKKNPLEPDNNHLHHFLFLLLKSKFNTKNITSNNLASIIINFFNLLLLYCGSQNMNYTPLQIKLLFSAVVIYLISYFFLRKIILRIKV